MKNNEKTRKNYFHHTKEQKENQRVLIQEFFIILGAVLLGEGIMKLLAFNPSFFIGLGVILFIMGVLWKNAKAN